MKSTVDNYEAKKDKNSGYATGIKNTINNMSWIKVHTKGRQRDEFKIWEAQKDKNSGYATGTRGIAVNARP